VKTPIVFEVLTDTQQLQRFPADAVKYNQKSFPTNDRVASEKTLLLMFVLASNVIEGIP